MVVPLLTLMVMFFAPAADLFLGVIQVNDVADKTVTLVHKTLFIFTTVFFEIKLVLMPVMVNFVPPFIGPDEGARVNNVGNGSSPPPPPPPNALKAVVCNSAYLIEPRPVGKSKPVAALYGPSVPILMSLKQLA